MEALKLSFPQSISPAAKKAAVPAQQDQALFASLLNSLSTETELPSEEQAPAEGLLENLESLLAFLQKVPVEEQTAEQQELQYAILQLQELQAAKAQVTAVPGQPNVNSTEAADNTADKLIGLLENIQQKLQILDSTPPAEAAETPVFKEAATQKSSINLTDLPQISKQLDELIAMLEKEQQAALAVQQGKSTGQEVPHLTPVEGVKVARDTPRFFNETLKPVKEIPKVPVETQETSQQAEAVEFQSSSAKLQGNEELQSPKLSADSKTVQEPTASVTGEAGKLTGNPIRTETNPPAAPFVRLSNLLEDLGGMLKSSMRMAETAEGMKMRVNIFPEHLGHLEILLTSTNGKLAAQIMASTPMAKEALELQLNQLRATLVQQGVAIEKIEVLQQSSQQPFSQQHSHTEQRFSQQQQRNGTTKQEKNGYFQPEEEKNAVRQPSVGQLMKVDYTV